MYGVGRLQQRTICVFNQFQIYDNIAEKGCAGGLKVSLKGLIYKNLQNVAKGGMTPRPMIPTMDICCP